MWHDMAIAWGMGLGLGMGPCKLHWLISLLISYNVSCMVVSWACHAPHVIHLLLAFLYETESTVTQPTSSTDKGMHILYSFINILAV